VVAVEVKIFVEEWRGPCMWWCHRLVTGMA
jgi:hypothetical protein